MNWIVFGIFAYVLLAMERGLDLLLAWKEASPSFVFILAVFVSLSATWHVVPWAMLLLGLFQDLTHTYDIAMQSYTTLIGPYCLGYLTGGYICTQLRSIVNRNSPMALVLLVMVAGMFMHLVTVALITARQLPIFQVIHIEPVLAWRASDELVRRFFALIYTTGMALPIGYILFWTEPIWCFAKTKGSFNWARRMR